MHVCLFDIDGTLLRSMGAGKWAMETALLEEFQLPAVEQTVKYSGRTDRAIMRDLLRNHGIDYTEENKRKLVAGYLERLPHSLKRHQGLVLPGIAELLRQLLAQPERMAIGLLTGNIQAGARAKLGHYGLFDYFAFGGFGDLHYERDDVAREALAAVYEKVGRHVQLDRIWVIGDTPHDVTCARAIGVRVAAVATGLHPREELERYGPDLVLEDLSDATPLVEYWK